MAGRTYQVAFVREDGGWDIVAELIAANDEQANNATETLYADTQYAEDWYVLDASGRNINGGHDQ